ncbi:NAD-binding of NADP-dependent 3-hydroxyisobutyrate dehydrogenase family protein [Yersinia pseudotuberculosis]|uniref:NAD(P)-dependent oxidoreductase n=1 Tax=Yersinia pseudotuberculosis TaxID=633 RepID=UPI0005AD4C90|nr:NAD(P)-dependent oxidoreductase [Yersinia pseudotuberculosis]AJJ01166.1 NAD-binding of NADP-dependent 3-hydroxyisobutyrate dehydrogenase family protein [Yersinia pseudotuberculosis]
MKQLQRIGFIGLGKMGTPMVQRLVKAGFELYLCDADITKVQILTAELNAESLTVDNAASLDALITMLPNSEAVEQALLGSDGISGWVAQLSQAAVVIDMSSSDPERSRRLAILLAVWELDYLDAPVSGGVKKAQNGTLSILIGGEDRVLKSCYTALAAMGEQILFVGPAGSGHAAKALNNYVSATGLLATIEALHVAQRFGIEPEVMTEVLNTSTGRSNTSENKVPQFMLNGSYASGFTLQLMNKDLHIARNLAQRLNYPMRLGMHCVDVWDEVSRRATPMADHTEMYRLLIDKEP